MKSVTSGLAPSRTTPDPLGGPAGAEPPAVTAALAMFGAGHTREVSEAKLAEAASLGPQGLVPTPVRKLVEAPASRATARTGGVADPRLPKAQAQSSAKPEAVIAGALAALDRVTDQVRDFHITPHLGPKEGATQPSRPRPEKLPRVLAAVTEGLRSLREAAAHFDSGRADASSHPGLAAGFERFVDVHAALIRGDEATYPYEQEPAFKDARALLAKRMDELWSLAPSFVGKDVAERLTRQRIPAVPRDLAQARAGAQALGRIVGDHLAPKYFAPRDPALRKIAQRLHDNVMGVDFFREGGRYAVGLSGVGVQRLDRGRALPQASLEEVESAARTVLAHSNLDPDLPIVVPHPGATPLRREEAWSVLQQAFESRDYITQPKSGSEYALRRWEPGTFELLPPPSSSPMEQWRSEDKILRIVQYTNGSLHRGGLRTFEEGTPERLEVDCREYLSARGLRDIHVEVTPARRALTLERAEAIKARILSAISADAPPEAGSPEALLKREVSAVTVERDAFAERREVVVYTKGTHTWDRERLEGIERAARALLTDDPQAIGAPIRVRLVPEPDHLGHLPEVSSIAFGEFQTEAGRQRGWSEYQTARAKLEQSPGLVEFLRKARVAALERFAQQGSAQAELVRAMRADPECAREDWKPSLMQNLAAWFLGAGSAEPAWRLRFEALPLSQRADLLELSLELLGDTAQAPALREALVTFRRLEGRVALEAACTRNGTQSPEQQAHTDALFGQGLSGPAREAALAAVAEARRA